MPFTGVIAEAWAMHRGTTLIVHSVEGELCIGDEVEFGDVTCKLIALAGEDWNPRTRSCLTGQVLDKPQWAFLVDATLSSKNRSSVKGLKVLGRKELQK